MPKISLQNKSFLTLFGLGLLGTILAIWLAKEYNFFNSLYQPFGKDYQTTIYKQPLPAPEIKTEPEPVVDTSLWKTYLNGKYQFAFKHHPNWSVKNSGQKNGFEILEIDPGPKFFNIKIYISPKQFYLMEGLPTKQIQINGFNALNVSDLLYGIEHNGIFFTFDNGSSLTIRYEFKALINSLEFLN